MNSSRLYFLNAVITMDQMHLYIDESKLDEEIKASFAKDGIVLHRYNDIYEDIKAYGAEETFLIDPNPFELCVIQQYLQRCEKGRGTESGRSVQGNQK